MFLRRSFYCGVAVLAITGCSGSEAPTSSVDPVESQLQAVSVSKAPPARALHEAALKASLEAMRAEEEVVTGPLVTPDEDGYVMVPGGKQHASCVFVVPNGSHIDGRDVKLKGRIIKTLPVCKHARKRVGASGETRLPTSARLRPPTVSGWVATTHTTTTTNQWGFDWINAFYGYWTVPNAPSSYTSQLIYLFNALEPTDGSFILQPVLHYGVSPAGGGNRWSMAAWYVLSDNTYTVSTLADAPGAGTWVLGDMYPSTTCPSSGACTWVVAIWAGGVGRTITVTPGAKVRWAFASALEEYNLTNCNQQPGSTSTTFFDNHLQVPGPSTSDYNDITSSVTWSDWAMSNPDPDCDTTASWNTGNLSSTITY